MFNLGAANSSAKHTYMNMDNLAQGPLCFNFIVVQNIVLKLLPALLVEMSEEGFHSVVIAFLHPIKLKPCSVNTISKLQIQYYIGEL